MNAARKPYTQERWEELREAAFQPKGLAKRVLDRVRRILGNNPPRTAAVQFGPLQADFGKTTADPEGRAASRQQALAGSLGLDPYEQTRRQAIGDYREIEVEVPELARAREVLIDFSFSGGTDEEAWAPKFPENARPEVVRVATDTYNRMNALHLVRGMIAEGVWLADSFVEMIYGLGREGLVGARHHVPELVLIRRDPETSLLDHYEIASADRMDPLLLTPFQMLHYAHTPNLGALYGRSMWHSARGIRRHHEAIQNMTSLLALRRGSGDFIWLWPFPEHMDDEQVDEHVRQAQEAALYNVFFDSTNNLRRHAASYVDMTPTIMPYRHLEGIEVKPDAIQVSPADVMQLVTLLQHLQDRFFVATGVPKALVGIERDVNGRATLEQQGLHFAMTVRRHQEDARALFVDLMIRGCLASGVVPEDGEIDVYVPASNGFDEALRATVAKERAQAVKSLVDAGTPLDRALGYGLGLRPQEVEPIGDAVADAAGGAVEARLAELLRYE